MWCHCSWIISWWIYSFNKFIIWYYNWSYKIFSRSIYISWGIRTWFKFSIAFSSKSTWSVDVSIGFVDGELGVKVFLGPAGNLAGFTISVVSIVAPVKLPSCDIAFERSEASTSFDNSFGYIGWISDPSLINSDLLLLLIFKSTFDLEGSYSSSSPPSISRVLCSHVFSPREVISEWSSISPIVCSQSFSPREVISEWSSISPVSCSQPFSPCDLISGCVLIKSLDSALQGLISFLKDPPYGATSVFSKPGSLTATSCSVFSKVVIGEYSFSILSGWSLLALISFSVFSKPGSLTATSFLFFLILDRLRQHLVLFLLILKMI